MIKKLLLAIALFICLLPQSNVFANEESMIIIKRATNELAYYENGKIVKTFTISANRSQNLSPVGTYKVVLKKEQPTYIADRIPGGHPSNPLGSHWLGFNYGDTDGKVYGIHGTNNASIIGSYTDKGNFSMHNEDIRWLYNRVNEGTKIAITNSTESFATIYRTITGKNPFGQIGNSGIALVINGVLQNPPQNPVMKDDRVFLPLRFIFEKIGAEVEWVNSERRIIATKDNKKLQLVIDSTIVRFNGNNNIIDTAPFVLNGYTYVPTRSVFEYFDYDVTWNDETRTVIINKKEKDPFLFYINDEVQSSSVVNRSQLILSNENSWENGDIVDLLVPGKYLFEKFGAQTRFLPSEKKFIISRNEINAELIADSKQIKINGYRELLENAPTIKNGEMLVPLEVALKLFGAERVILVETTDDDTSQKEIIIDLIFELKEFSKIYFNDNERLPYTGFIVNKVHYLPLSLIFIELDGEIVTEGDEIEIIRDGMLIQMHVDSHSAFVNGRLVYIPHPPKNMDGQMIVPLEFITNTLGVRLNVAGNIVHIIE